VRTFYFVLAVLLLWSPAMGREIYVDNAHGDNRFAGSRPQDPGGEGGPVRTLAKALRMAGPGDTIVLAKTDSPYRETISLVGSRLSGTSQQPFTIKGNGAVLDGSQPLPAEAWENYRGPIFRLHSTPSSGALLFLDGRPAIRVFVAENAVEPPQLQARQWCSIKGQIYFCVDPSKLPGDYKLSTTHLQTGITLFHVERVRIVDLTVQGFQVDGVNLSNSARDVRLVNVTCRGNGRAGVVVGGASSVTIRASLLGNNGQCQLLTLAYSETHVAGSHLLSNTAPAWVDRGGRVDIDGKSVQGGKDEFRPAAPPESKP
jgi:hypothetical protein